LAVNPDVLVSVWSFDDFSRRVATKLFQDLESDDGGIKRKAQYAILALASTLDALEHDDAGQVRKANAYLEIIYPTPLPADAGSTDDFS